MPNEIVPYYCHYVYAIFGVVFMTLGLVFKIMFISLIPYTDDVVNSDVIPVIIIATGCILMMYNILNDYTGSTRFLTLFCSIIFPISLFMQIGALGYGCYQIDYKDSIYKDIRSTLLWHKTNVANRSYFDTLEERMDCCGVDGPKDYPSTDIPASCCPINAAVGGNCKIENSYDIGCAARLYHETMLFIMISSAIILVLLLLQVCTGIFLCTKTGNHRLGADEEVQHILANNEEN